MSTAVKGKGGNRGIVSVEKRGWSVGQVKGKICIPDHTFQKVDSDRHFVVDGEEAFAVALDHRRLADSPVADDHDLKQGKRLGSRPWRS